MFSYEELLRPILFQLEPETAHDYMLELVGLAKPVIPLFPVASLAGAPELKTSLAGQQLASPIGLAAGFDKNARLVELMQRLGFGFLEIGSITARSTAGNPRPRLFRLPEDHALINRLGLNGDGAQTVAQRLLKAFDVPLGINIAKTNDPTIVGKDAVEDMAASFNCIKNLPLAYVALNVSCPNTQEGILESSRDFRMLLERISKENTMKKPIFIKLSPDSNEDFLEKIAETSNELGVSGFICGNTSTAREPLVTSKDLVAKIGNGGLSGPPIRSKALALCQSMYQLKKPEQQIIGCGGVTTGEDAYKFIKAGANAVQIYTSIVYRGPYTAVKIAKELSACLKKDRTSVLEAIGTETKARNLKR
jgi:dihydroorotate dehydrogenase